MADFNDTFEEVMEEEFAALRASFGAQIKQLKGIEAVQCRASERASERVSGVAIVM